MLPSAAASTLKKGLPLRSDTLRNVLITIYMIGNALTFNSVFKIERAAMTAGEPWAPILLKALGLALVWPIYWLWRLFT